jgi:tetratricopeptide (TPR) repeat protein
LFVLAETVFLCFVSWVKRATLVMKRTFGLVSFILKWSWWGGIAGRHETKADCHKIASTATSEMRNKSLCVGLALLLAGMISAGEVINGPVPKAQAPKTQLPNGRANSLLLQEAAQAIAAGKLDQAEPALQTVLGSAPEEYHALDLLGVVRVLQKRDGEADELFRRAGQAKPDFAPAHAHLGLLDVQRGNWEQAVPELREALRLDPGRSDASVALIRILENQAQAAATAGESDKALALLIDARKYEPDNPDVHFQLGLVALSMSLWQDAVVAFQRTLKVRENDALALYNLGRAFMGLAEFEEAREQFVRYTAARPDDPSGYCALGMTLAALQRSAEARAQFERSIAVAPAMAPAQTESYYRLGLLDLESKDWQSAARNLRQALDREQKHSGALTALGRVEFEQKHYTEAQDLLQQAVASDDASREAHYYLGLTLARLGRKDESDAQLQIAIHLEHNEVGRRRTVLRILDPAADAKGQIPVTH